MRDIEDEGTYTGVNFRAIDLSHQRLTEAEFDECHFERCTLQESTLVRCTFMDCRFTDCDLSMVTLDGSRLRETIFERCRVSGIDWTRAAWSAYVPHAPVTFDGCTLDYSTFLGLTLQRLVMRDGVAREVDFSEADLAGADFSGTDLAGSRFHQTTLTGANFATARNYSLDVTRNMVRGARFSLPEAVGLLRALEIDLVDNGY